MDSNETCLLGSLQSLVMQAPNQILVGASGHILDFENEDNISIGISLTFEVIYLRLSR